MYLGGRPLCRPCAHQYFDADASGNYDGTTYDNQGVTAQTGVSRVTGFVQWLKSMNARGHIGEYGIPNNDSRYLTTLQNMMDYLAANCVSGTYWSAGPWWGAYLLSVQPNGTQDRPQMSVLSKYGVNACTQSTYTPVTTPAPTVTTGQAVASGGTTKIDITKPTAVSQMQSEANGVAFDWGGVHPGGYIEFVLNVAAAGTYQVVINQASWSNNTGVAVLVNGTQAANVAFPETWNSWTYANTAPVNLPLPAGAVTFRLVASANANLNLAGISLTAVATTPASSASGQAVASTGTTIVDISKPTAVALMKSEANGVAFDWGGINPSAYIEFTLNVTAAGAYSLVVNQASWISNTGVAVWVNGVSIGNVVFSPTGNSWTYANTAPFAITLPAGVVKLRLVASQLATFNLAGLRLTKK